MAEGELNPKGQPVIGDGPKDPARYLRMARQCGVVREHLLEEQELAHKLSILRQVVYKAPAMDALANFKSDIEEWLREPSITIKKVWHRLCR